MGLYCTYNGKRFDFMQIACQNLKIICCVLSKLHNHLLKINKKMRFTELIVLLVKPPKIILMLLDLNKSVVRKSDKRGIW